MNKQEQIEDMAKIMQADLFQHDAEAQDLTMCLAEALSEKGYGNIEQAITEFVDFLKSKTKTQKKGELQKESWYNAFILNEHFQEFLELLKNQNHTKGAGR